MFISQLGPPKPFSLNFANSKPLLYDIFYKPFFLLFQMGRLWNAISLLHGNTAIHEPNSTLRTIAPITSFHS